LAGAFHCDGAALVFGDDVGVVTPWRHPGIGDIEPTPGNIFAIKQATVSGEWRKDVRAAMWVGNAIAQVLQLDAEDDAAVVKRLVKQLVRRGVLKEVPGRDPNTRKPCIFIIPVEEAAPVQETAATGANTGANSEPI
jgi:hypothetical protein